MDFRERLPNEPPLLEPERAIRLAKEATAFFESPGDGMHELSRLAVKTAMDAAHLAIETAIDTGDPHVLDAALELATRRARGWGPEHLEHEITFAVDPIFPAVTEVDNLVRSCARSKSAFLRSYTARGLGPRALRSLRGESPEAEAEVDAEAAQIVFALTKDKDADVRGAAREALGGAAPPAWATFFDRDPLAKLSAAEAARLRGPLDRAAEALEEGVIRDAAPLVEAIAELPDGLAAPILEAWMNTPYSTHTKGVEPLLERWVTLDSDAERTVKWLRSLEKNQLEIEAGAHLGRVLRSRSRGETLAFLTPIVRLLGNHRLGTFSVANGEGLLQQAWPDDEDRALLLETALGVPIAEAAEPEEGDAYPSGKLVTLTLAPGPGFDGVKDVLIDAFLAGMPGRWQRLAWQVEARLIEVSDPRLRAHAEAVVRDGDGKPLTWALRHLSQGGHDPAVDAPPDVMLANATRDPRLRKAIVEDPTLRAAALGSLRTQLTAGELAPTETVTVAKTLEEQADGLSPAEWEVVRRARVAIEEPRDRARAVGVLPPYPQWTEEDRTFVETLIEEHGDNLLVGLGIIGGLAPGSRFPEHPELWTLLERLRGRAKPGEPGEDALDAMLDFIEGRRGS